MPLVISFWLGADKLCVFNQHVAKRCCNYAAWEHISMAAWQHGSMAATAARQQGSMAAWQHGSMAATAATARPLFVTISFALLDGKTGKHER